MKIISSILEEIFPFVFFSIRKNKKISEASDWQCSKHRETFELYDDLSDEEMCERLNEEHERGKTLMKKRLSSL